ncbi:hypothetical protein SCP_1401010 [Sparassis crispa]|uniref:Uncharacterized protein n=1 Tax=Sparassis crispa TaxID=139825 RepID=A0A401H2L8_9APHY|nr:hypothetical protein SCP_1401010 [Sparassis crispa]GBE88696.1 hypothetical protein SCP_1401010 [Sparassis crispa]
MGGHGAELSSTHNKGSQTERKYGYCRGGQPPSRLDGTLAQRWWFRVLPVGAVTLVHGICRGVESTKVLEVASRPQMQCEAHRESSGAAQTQLARAQSPRRNRSGEGEDEDGEEALAARSRSVHRVSLPCSHASCCILMAARERGAGA